MVTFVDLREGGGDARQLSVSARHEAELPDGRRVLLLDDRGWTSSRHTAFQAGGAESTREQQLDTWATTSVEEIEQTARMVVGPDEPPAARPTSVHGQDGTPPFGSPNHPIVALASALNNPGVRTLARPYLSRRTSLPHAVNTIRAMTTSPRTGPAIASARSMLEVGLAASCSRPFPALASSPARRGRCRRRRRRSRRRRRATPSRSR